MACDYAETGGNVIRYAVEGNGPPLILIHEMTGSIESWDAVMPHLSDHRVLRYDMRGHGGSQKIVSRPAVRDFVDDLAGLQDEIGFPRPAVVIGIAVGAAVALGLAAWLPERVAGVVAFSPALGVPPESRPEREKKADALEKNGMAEIMPAAFDTGFPEKFRSGREAEFRIHEGRLRANDSRSMANCFRMLADTDGEKFLPSIECPVLMVGCSDDVMRPPAYVQSFIGRIRNARYTEIESGHHSAQLTPDAVGQTITGFAGEVAR